MSSTPSSHASAPPSSPALTSSSVSSTEAPPSSGAASVRTASLALCLVFGACGFYYFLRFLVRRQTPSLFIALLLPSGWFAFAAVGLGLLGPESAWVLWAGVALGALFLVAIVRSELRGEDSNGPIVRPPP